GVDRRPGGRRVHRRQHDMALDLLRQPAGRRPRARRDLADDAEADGAGRARDRLGRRGAPRGRNGGAAARARLGRSRLRVVERTRPRRARRRRLPARRLRVRRTARARADPPVRDPAQPDRRGKRRLHGARRHGDVRDDLVRAALRAGRDRHVGDLVRGRPDAADARRRRHLVRLRAARLANRPLPVERGTRSVGAHGGDAAPLADERAHHERRGGTQHGRRRDRDRLDDAGVRPLRAERGCACPNRRRDGADAVRAADGRDDRRHDHGRDRQLRAAGGRDRARHADPPVAAGAAQPVRGGAQARLPRGGLRLGARLARRGAVGEGGDAATVGRRGRRRRGGSRHAEPRHPGDAVDASVNPPARPAASAPAARRGPGRSSCDNRRVSPQRRAALTSVAAAAALIALKLSVGLATHSLGLVSEAIHSGTDFVAALLTFFAVGVAGRPADVAHQYGHGKAEHLTALAEAAFLSAASVLIAVRAFQRLFGSGHPQVHATWYALVVVVVVIAVDASRLVVSWHASRRYRSAALESNAVHFGSDLAGSLAVLAGLLVARGGYPNGDSIAALFVAVLVLTAAARLIKVNVDVLMDRVPAAAEERARAAIARLSPAVQLRRLRMRQAGGRQFADVVIDVPSIAGVGEGHAAADAVEQALEAALPGSDVV